jgi:hypothetical protein
VGDNQAGVFEYLQVLGNPLPAEAGVLAQFIQCLTITRKKLIHHFATTLVCQGFEYLIHRRS